MQLKSQLIIRGCCHDRLPGKQIPPPPFAPSLLLLVKLPTGPGYRYSARQIVH